MGGVVLCVALLGVFAAVWKAWHRPPTPPAKGEPAHHSHRFVDGQWQNYSTSGSGPYR